MPFVPCTFELDLQDVGVDSDFKDLLVRFELKNYEYVVPTVPGAFILLPSFKDFYPDANGRVSGTIVGNDVISPPDTYYTMSFHSGGVLFYRCDVVITGTNANLDNIRCLEILPPGASCLCEYDIQIFFPGLQLIPNQLIARLVFTRVVIFPENMLGSLAVAGVAAAAQTVLSINKNGVSFGTITFNAAATIGVFLSAPMTFEIGDILTVVGPAVPDISLNNISVALVGDLG